MSDDFDIGDFLFSLTFFFLLGFGKVFAEGQQRMMERWQGWTLFGNSNCRACYFAFFI